MNGELILILGGARSGKSGYAQQLALRRGGPDVLYVATAEPNDEEMRQRITAHRAERPPEWRTLEAQRDLGPRILDASSDARVVLLDCATLLVSNLLLALGDGPDLQAAQAVAKEEIESLLAACDKTSATWIVVSNEVGCGLVPPYPLGRVYRDVLGWVNQRLAARARSVLLMVAGLPMAVKGGGYDGHGSVC